MTKSKRYLALQAVVCVALVVLLSMSAIGIYREGTARKAEHPMESVYTPETAAQKFAPIAPLLFAGIGLLIAGLVLDVKDEDAQKNDSGWGQLLEDDFRWSGRPPEKELSGGL